MKKDLESALNDLKAGKPIEQVAEKYDLDNNYLEMLYQHIIAK